jgi:hypothetical protein
MNESYKVNMVQKSVIIYVVFFAIAGAMMVFLAPLLTEKAEALTKAKAIPSTNVKFSNLKYQLDQGKWVIKPHFVGPFDVIYWTTKGSGIFGGTERGSVEVDLKHRAFDQAHAKLSWYNPDRGANSCAIEFTGRDAWYFDSRSRCTIEQDAIANAEFRINGRS